MYIFDTWALKGSVGRALDVHLSAVIFNLGLGRCLGESLRGQALGHPLPFYQSSHNCYLVFVLPFCVGYIFLIEVRFNTLWRVFLFLFSFFTKEFHVVGCEGY